MVGLDNSGYLFVQERRVKVHLFLQVVVDQ